jgi:Domain of unknown function (DUF4440)
MSVSRRLLLTAALMSGIGAAAPFAWAQGSADEAALAKAVDTLRTAMIAADKAQLLALASEQLSYGHSSGSLENKAQYAEAIASKKAIFKTLQFQDQTIAVTGSTAIVRNTFVSDVEREGKVTPVKVGVMQVWQKDAAGWKLYARQAFKL